MESSEHGIITPQWVDKMLSSITFWKLEFNRYMMAVSLTKKYLASSCSAYSKGVGVYKLAEILSKMLRKINRKLVTLFTITICQFRALVPASGFADILYDHGPHERQLCIRKMLMNREIAYVEKCDFWGFFYTFLPLFGSFQGHCKCLYKRTFALFAAKNV